MHLQGLMNSLSLWILPVILIVILTVGLIKKVPIYEAFTDGAKDGFNVAVNIIPYLVAILVSISIILDGTLFIFFIYFVLSFKFIFIKTKKELKVLSSTKNLKT